MTATGPIAGISLTCFLYLFLANHIRPWHSVQSQSSGSNMEKLRPSNMGVALTKVLAFLLDPWKQIKLLSKKIPWMRSDVRAVKRSDYMGFQSAPEKRNVNHLPFASLQTQSRWSLLQIPLNSTLIQLQNVENIRVKKVPLWDRDYYCQVSWNA